MDFKKSIITVKDFPKKKITFRDITPLLNDENYYAQSISSMRCNMENKNFNKIVSPEARGFIFGCPLAIELRKSFIPARKAGKLPRETVSSSYNLHYGEDVIHIHKDATVPGDKVIIVDDVLATGGTSKSLIEIIECLGGQVVGLSYLIELAHLKGRDLLKEYEVSTVMHY